MAGVCEVFQVISEVADGKQFVLDGSTTGNTLIAPFATTGTTKYERGGSIAAGGSVTIYDYSASVHGFDLLSITADGFLIVEWFADAPTSADDRTPLGTRENYNRTGMSCNAAYNFVGDDCYVPAGETDGTRGDFMEASMPATDVTAKIYRVKLKNPGTAAVNYHARLID